jgi:hypothetical protein
MTQQKSSRSTPATGAPPGKTRGAAAKRQRELTAAWLSLSAGVLVMALAFALAPLLRRDAPSSELTTGTIDTHRLGTIVTDDGRTRCMRGTFDNRTGQISQGPASCQVVVDTDPLGRARRLSAISNGFK